MLRRMLAVAALALACMLRPAGAHGPNDPPHQGWAMGDFRLESGETIRDFRISYVTHGILNAARSNAILMVTAIGGNHHRLDFMIGPGRALDTNRYFIVATDAIGNGLTTSPSNSTAQPRMAFPRFSVRDMVASQHRLMTEHLGIPHVVAVVGPSMGGMQVLQWGVSHPNDMDGLVAMVPLARTPAWTVAVLDASRQAIMLDPAWNGGNYTAPPERGIRLWRTILSFLSARTPEMYRDQFRQDPMAVLPWLEQQTGNLVRAFDANDWIYQSWAYERHNIAQTPGMGGDMDRALRSITAPTLVLTGTTDLLNPEYEPQDAAQRMPNARVVTIRPGSVTGHASAGGGFPEDIAFLNREVTNFMNGLQPRR